MITGEHCNLGPASPAKTCFQTHIPAGLHKCWPTYSLFFFPGGVGGGGSSFFRLANLALGLNKESSLFLCCFFYRIKPALCTACHMSVEFPLHLQEPRRVRDCFNFITTIAFDIIVKHTRVRTTFKVYYMSVRLFSEPLKYFMSLLLGRVVVSYYLKIVSDFAGFFLKIQHQSCIAAQQTLAFMLKLMSLLLSRQWIYVT